MRPHDPCRCWPARAAALLVLLLGAASADARDSGPVATAAIRRIGFDGLYKVGKWTPLEVEVTADAPVTARLVVETSDPRGNLARFPSPRQELGAGTHRLQTYFQSGRLDGPVRAYLEIESGDTPQTLVVEVDPERTDREPLTQSVRLVATLGQPAGFDAAADERRPSAEEADSLLPERRVVSLEAPEQLPADATGYDSLDVLVISAPYTLDEARDAALREWVHGGGHLVLAIGRHLDGYAAQAPDWVPVAVDPQPLLLRDLSSVETYIERSTRLQLPGRQADVARLRLTHGGQTLIASPQGPLLVRAACGFGKVTAFALDLDSPPLATWPDVPKLAARLISDRRDAVAGTRTQGALVGSGITDIATQLKVVQEQFEGVDRLPLWIVMLAVLGYLLVVGPLDYLLVNRLLHRPRLTWITLPLLAAGAFALSVWGARQTNGDELLLNQIDLIDIAADAPERARVRNWMTLYSPQSRRYGIATQSPPLSTTSAASPRIELHAVPEATYGGLYREGGFRIERPVYHFTPGADAIADLPIPIWGTANLAVQWSGPTPPLAEAELRGTSTGRLEGTWTHRLPGPITDWVIAYKRRVYLPGEQNVRIAPGQSVSVDERAGQSPEIAFYLTKTVARRVQRYKGVGDEILLEQGTYDPLQGDVPAAERLADILRMMTFHEAAGGTAYTHLEHESLRELDLSDHVLDLNRAVLFGRLDLAAMDVRVDGEPVPKGRRKTFVRIVFPVESLSPGDP